jgi:nitroreductase
MNPLSPTDLIRERYGSNTFNPEHLWNETLTTLLSHRSVRAYLPDALPSQTLETLIAAAQAAATSSNLQTWSVVAIEDPARKSTLAQLAGNQASRDSTGIGWARSFERTVTPTWIPAAVMAFSNY